MWLRVSRTRPDLVQRNLQCGVLSADYNIGVTMREAEFKLFVSAQALDVELDIAVAEAHAGGGVEACRNDRRQL